MTRRSPFFLGLVAALMLLCAGVPAAAAADVAPAADVSVDGAWAQMSGGRARTAYVYLTLSVAGAAGDRLVSAHTPLAERAELLAPVKGRGRDLLAPTRAIEIDPHAPTVLQPLGPHIILRGLKHPLAPGDSFVMTLDFATAGSRDASVKVLRKPPGEGAPSLPKDLKLD